MSAVEFESEEPVVIKWFSHDTATFTSLVTNERNLRGLELSKLALERVNAVFFVLSLFLCPRERRQMRALSAVPNELAFALATVPSLPALRPASEAEAWKLSLCLGDG